VVPLTRRPRAAGDLSPRERGEVLLADSEENLSEIAIAPTAPRPRGERSPQTGEAPVVAAGEGS
jgi:hypothetical protein